MKNVLVFGGLRIHTVPKVASTSVSAAMATSDFRRADPFEESDDWRFMVVRHPLDRLVSAWQFFTPHHRMQHMRVFRHDVTPDCTFRQFLDVVLQAPHKDRHTAPQTRYKGPHPIDDLVRLENLSEGWERLVGRFPVVPIPHKNQTEHGHWREYFDAAMARDALAYFEADLELYDGAA